MTWPALTPALSVATAAILGGIGLLHVCWLFGARDVSAAVVPEVDGAPAFRPTAAQTAAVAGLLAMAAALVAARGGWIDLPGPAWVPRVGTAGVAAVLALRAIGDFRLVGLFKRVRGTRFARWDARLFTPLCIALSAACAVVAW